MKLFGKIKNAEKTVRYFFGLPYYVKKNRPDGYVKKVLFGLVKAKKNADKTKLFVLGVPFYLKKNANSELKSELDTIKNELNALKLFLSFSTDVTKIQPAQGLLRDFQLSALTILKEIDFICRQHGISYFLSYGTLLGAVRHKGFVPWDDDLDIIMPREDFDRFLDVFEKAKRTDKIQKYFWSNGAFNVLKIYEKLPKTSALDSPFVDIHAYDSFFKKADEDDRERICTLIKEACRKVEIKSITDIEKQQTDIIRNIERFKKYTHDVICAGKVPENKEDSSLFIGSEFPIPFCYDYDDVFPLTKIEFEDGTFSAPNKYLKILFQMYGDFMKPHIDGNMYHFNFKKFTYEALEEMKCFSSKAL